jgi:hypothetical protein
MANAGSIRTLEKVSVVVVEMKKWMVLGATLVLFVAAMVFGETPTPCYEAYLMSGLNEQQMSFEEFREAYGESVCVRSDERASLAG